MNGSPKQGSGERADAARISIFAAVFAALTLVPVAVGTMQAAFSPPREYNQRAVDDLRRAETRCRDDASDACDRLFEARETCDRLGCTYDEYFTRARLAGIDLPPLYVSRSR